MTLDRQSKRLPRMTPNNAQQFRELHISWVKSINQLKGLAANYPVYLTFLDVGCIFESPSEIEDFRIDLQALLAEYERTDWLDWKPLAGSDLIDSATPEAVTSATLPRTLESAQTTTTKDVVKLSWIRRFAKSRAFQAISWALNILLPLAVLAFMYVGAKDVQENRQRVLDAQADLARANAAKAEAEQQRDAALAKCSKKALELDPP